jgi:hypothetical protein
LPVQGSYKEVQKEKMSMKKQMLKQLIIKIQLKNRKKLEQEKLINEAKEEKRKKEFWNFIDRV